MGYLFFSVSLSVIRNFTSKKTSAAAEGKASFFLYQSILFFLCDGVSFRHYAHAGQLACLGCYAALRGHLCDPAVFIAGNVNGRVEVWKHLCLFGDLFLRLYSADSFRYRVLGRAVYGLEFFGSFTGDCRYPAHRKAKPPREQGKRPIFVFYYSCHALLGWPGNHAKATAIHVCRRRNACVFDTFIFICLYRITHLIPLVSAKGEGSLETSRCTLHHGALLRRS